MGGPYQVLTALWVVLLVVSLYCIMHRTVRTELPVLLLLRRYYVDNCGSVRLYDCSLLALLALHCLYCLYCLCYRWASSRPITRRQCLLHCSYRTTISPYSASSSFCMASLPAALM